MPGDNRFGVTRYYRHQQYPDIWTVAIGQLNEFWVDDDDLVVVDDAAINAALNPGAAPTTGTPGTPPAR